MEQAIETTTETELPAVMTVLGREYRLHDAEECPPRWYSEKRNVLLWGYRGSPLWAAQATVDGRFCSITIHGSGETPEAAVLDLRERCEDVDAQRDRVGQLVRQATITTGQRDACTEFIGYLRGTHRYPGEHPDEQYVYSIPGVDAWMREEIDGEGCARAVERWLGVTHG